MMITSHSNVADNCSRSIMDGGAESPLEVLSRAATMVQQENQQASLAEEASKNLHKQTNKWKRDRRRLPEYSRKSDPKIPETFGVEPSSPEASLSNGNNALGNLNGTQIKSDQSSNGSDTPLDMSVRHRGLPPSYAQTISNPSYRSSYRPTVIPNGVPNGREELPSGISMCDPVIEEHFRRSLGDNYHMLYHNNNSVKDKDPPTKAAPKVSVIELMEDTTISVDDHFAKALGDTWKQLNKKDEIKNMKNESNLVTIKN
ncbi:transcription cofactor vestigial-like protein 4 [Cylas formicarius]|uniref:transcription cofactor vestigial-like protein 4 n=1 Tax=Cylas formicarius TaxID=197179 RepID=UPI002958A7E5|nr:transcription cofactor vestigial-like protein 4 [Cylas formicarius]